MWVWESRRNCGEEFYKAEIVSVGRWHRAEEAGIEVDAMALESELDSTIGKRRIKDGVVEFQSSLMNLIT